MPTCEDALRRFLAERFGERLVWLPEYAQIAAWLSENQARGLWLVGGCGVGKTVICREFIVPLILAKLERRVTVVQAMDLARPAVLAEVRRRRWVYVDDVGVETITNDYGTRYEAFSELVSSLYFAHGMLIFSTNYRTDEISERYGYRTLDRLNDMCRRVTVVHSSFRTP